MVDYIPQPPRTPTSKQLRRGSAFVHPKSTPTTFTRFTRNLFQGPKSTVIRKTEHLRKRLERSARFQPKCSIPAVQMEVKDVGGKKTIGTATAIVMIVNQVLSGGVEQLPEGYLQMGWLPMASMNVLVFSLATIAALMTARSMTMISGNQLFDLRYEYVATVRHFLGDATATTIEAAFHFLMIHSLLSFTDLVQAFDALLLHPLCGFRAWLRWHPHWDWMPRFHREIIVFDGTATTIAERFAVPPWVSQLSADGRLNSSTSGPPMGVGISVSLGYLILAVMMSFICRRNLDDDQWLQKVAVGVTGVSWIFLIALALPRLPSVQPLITACRHSARFITQSIATATASISRRAAAIVRRKKRAAFLRETLSPRTHISSSGGRGTNLWRRALTAAAIVSNRTSDYYEYSPRLPPLREADQAFYIRRVSVLMNTPGVTAVQLNYQALQPVFGDDYSMVVRMLSEHFAFGSTCGSCFHDLCFDALEVSSLLICPNPFWAAKVQDMRLKTFVQDKYQAEAEKPPMWPVIIKHFGRRFMTFGIAIKLWGITDLVPSLCNESKPGVNVSHTVWSATCIALGLVIGTSFLIATSFPGLASVTGTSPVALILSSYLPQWLSNLVILLFAIFTIVPNIVIACVTSRYNLVNTGKLTNSQAVWVTAILPFVILCLAPWVETWVDLSEVLVVIAALLCNFVAPILCYLAATNKSPLAVRDEVRKDFLRLSITAFRPRHGDITEVQSQLRHWARYAGSRDPQLKLLLRCSSPSKRAAALARQRQMYMKGRLGSAEKSSSSRADSERRTSPFRTRGGSMPDLAQFICKSLSGSFHRLRRHASGSEITPSRCKSHRASPSDGDREEMSDAESDETPAIVRMWRTRYPVEALEAFHQAHAYEGSVSDASFGTLTPRPLKTSNQPVVVQPRLPVIVPTIQAVSSSHPPSPVVPRPVMDSPKPKKKKALQFVLDPTAPSRDTAELRRRKTAAIRVTEEQSSATVDFHNNLEKLRATTRLQWSKQVDREVSELFPTKPPSPRSRTRCRTAVIPKLRLVTSLGAGIGTNTEKRKWHLVFHQPPTEDRPVGRMVIDVWAIHRLALTDERQSLMTRACTFDSSEPLELTAANLAQRTVEDPQRLIDSLSRTFDVAFIAKKSLVAKKQSPTYIRKETRGALLRFDSLHPIGDASPRIVRQSPRVSESSDDRLGNKSMTNKSMTVPVSRSTSTSMQKKGEEEEQVTARTVAPSTFARKVTFEDNNSSLISEEEEGAKKGWVSKLARHVSSIAFGGRQSSSETESLNIDSTSLAWLNSQVNIFDGSTSEEDSTETDLSTNPTSTSSSSTGEPQRHFSMRSSTEHPSTCRPPSTHPEAGGSRRQSMPDLRQPTLESEIELTRSTSRDGRRRSHKVLLKRQKVRRIEVFPFDFLRRRQSLILHSVLYLLVLLPVGLLFWDWLDHHEIVAAPKCDLVIDASSLFDYETLASGGEAVSTIRSGILPFRI